MCAPLIVTECEFGAGVTDDKIDRFCRETIIYRNRNQPCAHDAEVCSEVLGAVGGKNCNAVATREATPPNGASNTISHGIKGGIADFAWITFVAQIDNCDL